jgi:hypothetical protein
MIKTQRQVSDYYYNESRDFQLIGRIFEGVFNSTKTALDTIVNTPLSSNYDISLIDLLTKTVGFESKRKYDVPNLLALVNSFKSILKIKGTKKAIEDCVRILLKAQNITDGFEVLIDTSEIETSEKTIHKREALIYIPKEVKDIALLEDMLDYVLPAGFNYSICIAKPGVPGIGAEAVSVDILALSSEYDGSEIGVITPGLVTLDENELNNATSGVTDNTVIVWPSNE